MKLSELTGNAAILIKKKKHLNPIWNALKENGFEWSGIGENNGKKILYQYFHITEGNLCVYVNNGTYSNLQYAEELKYEVYPASRFLKSTPTKKELQAAISIVGDELAYLREEVNMIKKNSEIKEFNANIEVEFENVKEGLPEKWAVFGNDAKIQNWFDVNGAFEGVYSKHANKFYYHYPSACDGDVTTSHELIPGYTEITFEQFKKYVLKEEDQPEAIDWSKSGQFFRSTLNGCIVINNGDHNKDTFTGTLLYSNAPEAFSDGTQVTYWDKSYFTLCTEPITLKN